MKKTKEAIKQRSKSFADPIQARVITPEDLRMVQGCSGNDSVDAVIDADGYHSTNHNQTLLVYRGKHSKSQSARRRR